MAAAGSIRLFYIPGSPFARVARIVALERGVPHLLIPEMEFPPRQVEAFNPAMQVPTLVDGDQVLFGTRLIVDYLLALPAGSAAEGSPPFAARTTRAKSHWQDAQLLVALETLLSALVSRSYLIWTGATHRTGAAIPLDLAERERDRARRLLDWLEDRAVPMAFGPASSRCRTSGCSAPSPGRKRASPSRGAGAPSSRRSSSATATGQASRRPCRRPGRRKPDPQARFSTAPSIAVPLRPAASFALRRALR